jgi:hypothetical protein
MRKIVIIGIIIIGLGIVAYKLSLKYNWAGNHKVGDHIDSLNGVLVYYNGGIENVEGRNIAKDGYNLGLKYQCVEFVKRYYYLHLKHKMPDSYGHAKDFYEPSLKDGSPNKKRNLLQYTNPSKSKPKADDLLIYSGTLGNPFGHVAIVAKVSETELEIIQQNPGAHGNTRDRFKLALNDNLWRIENDRILGWLRKKQ